MKIIKIYQYESRFQSMSVLVHDSEDEKYYIFAKGAPEVILSNSTVKYDYFEDLLQNVSYGGFRTLAYGFKEVLKS
jgi:magnesium-transporting ATPase (P-type)